MHYIIYRTLNKVFISNEGKRTINPGQENELAREQLFIPIMISIKKQFKNADILAILHGLAAKNLIGSFEIKTQELEKCSSIAYMKVAPNTLGVQLFAIANNMFEDWQSFPIVDFGDFDDVPLPKYYAQSLNGLLEKIRFSKPIIHDQDI